jgi:hypothetical protein
MTENTLTAADVAAVTRNNDGGMFGNDSWAWIVILLLFAWGGNRGFGGFGGGGIGENYSLATDFATIERKLDGVNNGLCDGFYAQNTNMLNGFASVQQTLCQGFSGVDRSIANLGYQQAQCCCDTKSAIKDVGIGIERNGWTLSKQISDCCCDLEKMNMQNRFDAQAYNCNTLQAIDKLGDRIIDYMAAEKTQALRDENQALRLAASQERQNRYLVNELRPCPVPAYITCNPYAYTNPCGCGNGSF